MKSTKNFNNFSPELKALIPKLKPGERVSFQMLNGVPNPEPDQKERAKQGDMLYGKVQLITNYRVYDKFQKDSDGKVVGGYVDGGCVDQWDGDRPSRFRRFMPGVTPVHLHNLAFGGKFDLVGGKASDEELFEALFLSPEREGSPCPDPSFEIKFKIIDEKATSKTMVNRVDRLKRVLDIVTVMEEEEARGIMAALNQPKYQDKEIMMANLKNFAISNVDQFITIYDSKESPLKATIKKAMEAGVLEYNLKTGAVIVGGATIATIKVSNADAFQTSFLNWVNTAENGKDVLNNITNQMKKKEEEEVVV